MRKFSAMAVLFMAAVMCVAAAPQQNDPVIMTVNGQPVLRSEFEYSYNKNNTEGVIDKKTVDEYVDLFINYKLKVVAALDAKYDTLTSYQQEFAQYRDQQVRPTMVTEADVLQEARRIYDETKKSIGPDGLIQTAHILVRVQQQGEKADLDRARVRIDSIYGALKAGADFAELASKVSEDPGSARNGGLVGWASRGQFVKEYEDAAFALKEGEMSGIVQSPFGFHVILMKGRKELEPFEFHKDNILKFIEQRGLRDRIAEARLNDIVKQSDGQLTREQVMQQRADSLSAVDSEMKYLIQEYHDGLLLYEISNRLVWDRAAKDEAGLASYFARNKKKYAWSEPRFKGIAYHTREEADVKAVQQCVKKLPFAQWNEALRTTFNADSVLRIRAEKGIFKAGDNALVDQQVFGRDTVPTPLPDYPFDAVFGKKLKKGPEDYTDVRGQVTADYQDELEREWVADLRRRYSFSVNTEVLKTVNNHDSH
jgi:peptidyl-prolyl cis-trans isomerase SurA